MPPQTSLTGHYNQEGEWPNTKKLWVDDDEIDIDSRKVILEKNKKREVKPFHHTPSKANTESATSKLTYPEVLEATVDHSRISDGPEFKKKLISPKMNFPNLILLYYIIQVLVLKIFSD